MKGSLPSYMKLNIMMHMTTSIHHTHDEGDTLAIYCSAGSYVSNVSIIFDCSMLLYYLFWMVMGFTLQFYIIFGTNLLTGGQPGLLFFAYFSVSKKRNIKRSPNAMKPWGAIFLEQMPTRRLGVDVKQQMRRPRGCPANPPPSWAPRASTDLLLPPIYTHVPRKHQGSQREPNSIAVTFCIREIPTWSLRRRSAGWGIDHGGPLHHLQGLSDEL